MKDWLLRFKGLHAITVYRDGSVIYSVGKQQMFILKANILQDIESLVKMNLTSNNDDEDGNILRYNEGKKVYAIRNVDLYTQLWKIIYDANNVKGNIDELDCLTKDVEYVIIYGYLDSEVPLKVPDPNLLMECLGLDVYIDSLVNIILTKESKIYYDKKSFSYSQF